MHKLAFRCEAGEQVSNVQAGCDCEIRGRDITCRTDGEMIGWTDEKDDWAEKKGNSRRNRLSSCSCV